MTQLIELKQNRDFIEADFPGYKLSLQEIPKSTINLSSKVHIVFPTNEQYTYKHAKLFALHNHILASELDELEGTESIYYIGHDRLIHQVKLDILGIEEVCINWKVPNQHLPQDWNFTMVLPNENLAVVSDGGGGIYILDRKNEWKCIFSDTFSFSAIIMDCKSIYNILHVIIFHIASNDNGSTENVSKHKSIINWLQYECINNQWQQKSLEELCSESELHNIMLSCDKHLYLLSSEGGFTKNADNEDIKQPRQFTWCQDTDFIGIYIKGTFVDVKHQHIIVKHHEEVVLDGKLYDFVNCSMTSWTKCKNDVIEISLCKVDDIHWPMLIQGQPQRGECFPDEKSAKLAHDKMSHSRFDAIAENIPTKSSTLTDEVEECDFVSSKGAFLERISSEQKITHRVILTQDIIFVDNDLERFAIQQNEDVCLYKPVRRDDADTFWDLEHVGTLFALGYIRASKQRRKFTTCAPDLSYSIVAEGGRHVFVYRQSVDVTSGELRHRKSGKHIKQLAQQQVIELEKYDNILGVRATNNICFVLTECKAYVFKMN